MPLAWLWALSLVVVWTMVAATLHQGILAQQASRALVAFGAIKGSDLTVSDAWRLVVAQWLHVNAAHMLLNAGIIAVVGARLERQTSARAMMAIGLTGGVAGLWAASMADPAAFLSGASQAYLSLCGAALVLLPRRGAVWWISLAATAVAIALDARVAGMAKIGHVVGFATGIACGGMIAYRRRRMQAGF